MRLAPPCIFDVNVTVEEVAFITNEVSNQFSTSPSSTFIYIEFRNVEQEIA